MSTAYTTTVYASCEQSTTKCISNYLQYDIDGDGVVEPAELVKHARRELESKGLVATRARIMRQMLKRVAPLNKRDDHDGFM